MVCVAAPRAEADGVSPVALEQDSFKFDRRRWARRPAGSWMPATFADGEGRFGLTNLELIDSSATGIGVRCPSRVEPGMTLSFHPPGCRYPALAGRVVCCTEGDEGFRLGLVVLGPNRAA